MKQRVISSLIGLVVLFTVLMLFETIVLNIMVAVISLMAVYELLAAVGMRSHPPVFFLAMLFAGCIPFFSVSMLANNLIIICYGYAVALFAVLLRRHGELKIEQLALAFMLSLVIPFSLTTLVYQRDYWGSALGIFYVLVSLGGAWLSDTGAFFVGCAFGKHKLAPEISPKKTVEGAVGGAAFAIVFMLLIAWLYSLACAALGYPIRINYALLAVLTPLLSVAGMLGDLSASVIKRQFHVKDYGSIMPGHGGIMDRFDSVLMVLPLVYIISRYLPLAA